MIDESHLIMTPRLTLRRITPQDAPTLHSLCARSEIRRAAFDGHIPPRVWVEQLVWSAQQHFQTLNAGLWTITPGAEANMMGVVGIRTPEAHMTKQGPLFSILLDPACWHLGYAREACLAIVRHLRTTEIKHVHMEVSPHNTPAIALCESLGMQLASMIALQNRPLLNYTLAL